MEGIFFILIVIIGAFLSVKARSSIAGSFNYNKTAFQNNLSEKKKNVFRKFLRIFATWDEG